MAMSPAHHPGESTGGPALGAGQHWMAFPVRPPHWGGEGWLGVSDSRWVLRAVSVLPATTSEQWDGPGPSWLRSGPWGLPGQQRCALEPSISRVLVTAKCWTQTVPASSHK